MSAPAFGEPLIARALAIGAARAEAARARVAEAAAREVPAARIVRAGDAVVIEGRGLRPALNWIGSLVR